MKIKQITLTIMMTIMITDGGTVVNDIDDGILNMYGYVSMAIFKK